VLQDTVNMSHWGREIWPTAEKVEFIKEIYHREQKNAVYGNLKEKDVDAVIQALKEDPLFEVCNMTSTFLSPPVPHPAPLSSHTLMRNKVYAHDQAPHSIYTARARAPAFNNY